MNELHAFFLFLGVCLLGLFMFLGVLSEQETVKFETCVKYHSPKECNDTTRSNDTDKNDDADGSKE